MLDSWGSRVLGGIVSVGSALRAPVRDACSGDFAAGGQWLGVGRVHRECVVQVLDLLESVRGEPVCSGGSRKAVIECDVDELALGLLRGASSVLGGIVQCRFGAVDFAQGPRAAAQCRPGGIQ